MTWIDRLYQERKILEQRIERLAKFINSEKFDTLNLADKTLIYDQYSHMNSYLYCLNLRISRIERGNEK